MTTKQFAKNIVGALNDYDELWTAQIGFADIIFVNLSNGQEFSLHIVEDKDE